MGTCTFAELISTNWPHVQEDIPAILAQAQKVLFILDMMMRQVPSEALIHDICGDWKKQKPVPVLLGSLLKRKMLPKATLLITTRPGALRELRLLTEQPLFIEIEGFLEEDRKAYFLKHFEEESQALRAFDLMKNNEALFQLGSAPSVCWMVCTCLRQQMERGEDPAATCRTTTALFLRFLCSRFPPPHGGGPRRGLRAPLKPLCLLAAEGVWMRSSVFDGEDLRRLGVDPSALCPFLDGNILQKSEDGEACYSFIHLSVQQLLAAMFYVLELEEQEEEGLGGRQWHVGNVGKLLSKEERLKNPSLTHVGYFLFGLCNERRAMELETTFGCLVSTEIKRELLKYTLMPHGKKSFSVMDTKEVLSCLYESQEEQLVKDAMAHVKEMSLHLKNETDVVHSSFCLKHCGNFLKNISPADTYRNFCMAFGGHKTLTHLTLQGNDQNDMLPPLCEVLRNPKCNLQYLRLVSCSATTQQWADLSCCLKTNQSLTCLNLTANEFLDEGAKLLYMTLRYPTCFLQRLSLENCQLTEAYCKDLSSALIVNQRLTHLCLAKNALGDRGVKLLCEGLTYPECQLQTLVLWCCNITSDGCIHLSTLLQQNSSLTHLDLGLNHIGIIGLKFLCEALKKPLCKLRCLWLWGCAITPFSCAELSSALRSNQNLITLDLGQNSLGSSGVNMLCDALKLQSCPLQTLRLKIDESDAQIQKLLREMKESNPQLTIESDHRDPKDNRPSSHDFIF
uniref:NACHT domain-containing protein n=1 Tax=Bos taurus TaxID=9913 RepID=A0A3Q1MRD1_BOVIN